MYVLTMDIQVIADIACCNRRDKYFGESINFQAHCAFADVSIFVTTIPLERGERCLMPQDMDNINDK